MREYKEKRLALVTAILPKDRAGDVIDSAVPKQLATQLVMSARGTLYKDKWYHNLRPVISPEKSILQLLVPERLSYSLMNNISQSAGLHDTGTGIIYSALCQTAVFMNEKDFTFDVPDTTSEHPPFKHHLNAIYCIIQKGKADKISTAAIRAGSHGPIITFGQGRGVREKMGLLRIAINPEKELVQLVVDHYNTEPVVEAMIQEGRLFAPGMGFIYVVPLEMALVKVPIASIGTKELAHHFEIIKAIDELKGGSNWRLHSEVSSKIERSYMLNLAKLTCVVERGRSDSLLDAAMAAGAPGASLSFGIDTGAEKESELGFAINREVEIIEITLSPELVPQVLEAVTLDAQINGSPYDYFYVHHVDKAFTYLH